MSEGYKGGFVGKMAFVNLTTGSIEVRELDDKLGRDFIGGPSLGARILYDMIKPGIDPLGPENVVGYVTGVLTGTGCFFGGRYTVVCKSPVTGGFNDANSGGFLGPELKKAGFDAVFISGASEEPVYLWIKDGQIEIRSAAHIWGKFVKEAEAMIKEEVGEPRLRSGLIGPAGERLSLMSCIINDTHRAAARGGLGAVFGSKKLKGIAVRGTGTIPVANREKVNELNRWLKDLMANGDNAEYVNLASNWGTAGSAGISGLTGDSPIRNWKGSAWEDEDKAMGLTAFYYEKYKTKKFACANCPIGCGAKLSVDHEKYHIPDTDRPEYETISAFGFTCENGDPESVLKCNEICSEAGLDTISTGDTIAWVMECYENGLLTKDDLDGLDATWGNADTIVALTEKIAMSEGVGNILKLGSERAANYWGKGHEYLVTYNGIESAMHDPRYVPGIARTYAFDPTPGRHTKGGLYGKHAGMDDEKYDITEETGREDFAETCWTEMNNASGQCMFVIYPGAPNTLVIWQMAAVTGWDLKDEDLISLGWRSIDMRQSFNVREGIKPAGFKNATSRSVGEPPLEKGPTAGRTVKWREQKKLFFEAIEWDEDTGRPSKESLLKLGLDDVARDLYPE